MNRASIRGVGRIARRRRAAAMVVVATLVLGQCVVARAGQAAGIVDIPVSFVVSNVNRTDVECAADGRAYTVHGTFVAPASTLGRPHGGVTLYVHGFEVGQQLWRGLDLGASHDFARTMAQLGHASITLDLLGYGISVTDKGPDGFLVCYGSVADVVHQIIGQLRDGTYATERGRPLAFDRVALAGHAGYGPAAQLAAYSLGGIDALIVMGYAGATSDPVTLGRISSQLTLGCRLEEGGSPKWDDASGPQAGYYWHFPRDEAAEWWFEDASPAVRNAWTRSMERDPCGAPLSATRVWTIADSEGLPSIDVPVLIAVGERDRVYPPPTGDLHAQRFTGSSDVEVMTFPGAGHLFHLERGRDMWTGQIAGWLAARGFGSSPSDTNRHE